MIISLRASKALGQNRIHALWLLWFSSVFLRFTSWCSYNLEILFMELSANPTGSCASQSFLTTYDAQSLWKLKLKIIPSSPLLSYAGFALTITAWSTCIHHLWGWNPTSPVPVCAASVSFPAPSPPLLPVLALVIACMLSSSCLVCHSHCWETDSPKLRPELLQCDGL